MPDENVKRRSDRIAMAIPVRISGEDEAGREFVAEARTVNLSRHGATIVLPQQLKPDQEVKIRHPRRAKEAMFRVVGRIGGGSEGFVYGFAQLDPGVDLWGIGFPPMADSKRVVGRLLMECFTCRNQEVVYMNELEVQVFQANQTLTRPCDKCMQVRVWRAAPDEAAGKKGSAAPSAPGGGTAEATPQPSTVGRRRNTRVNARLLACIRQQGFADEVVMTENMSRGGLCFRSPKAYVSGSPLEVAVPFSAGGANIFVAARVAHVFEKGGDKVFRVGVAYVRSEDFLHR